MPWLHHAQTSNPATNLGRRAAQNRVPAGSGGNEEKEDEEEEKYLNLELSG
ncbi:hypothetical protein VTN00DRAFT_7950 [Thermoascus crustaceus]|uniref:uncharacterized protein n=1 Tax=Thermoascus crustaceus TaxID=5088 RepID=UPI00374220BA